MTKYNVFTCPTCKGNRFTKPDDRGCSGACPTCGMDGCVQLPVEPSPKAEEVPSRLIRDLIAVDRVMSDPRTTQASIEQVIAAHLAALDRGTRP